MVGIIYVTWSHATIYSTIVNSKKDNKQHVKFKNTQKFFRN
jgi:hypothetical protein